MKCKVSEWTVGYVLTALCWVLSRAGTSPSVLSGSLEMSSSDSSQDEEKPVEEAEEEESFLRERMERGLWPGLGLGPGLGQA